jgi:hypothetical protein
MMRRLTGSAGSGVDGASVVLRHDCLFVICWWGWVRCKVCQISSIAIRPLVLEPLDRDAPCSFIPDATMRAVRPRSTP